MEKSWEKNCKVHGNPDFRRRLFDCKSDHLLAMFFYINTSTHYKKRQWGSAKSLELVRDDINYLGGRRHVYGED